MAKAKAKKTDAPTEDIPPPAQPEKPKPTGLRLLRMKVENLMRIIIAEITPNGESIDVWGENEQGKSSLLNAVWIAMGGKDVEPEMPVRKGAKEATIEAVLGEINTPQLIVKYRRTADEPNEEGKIVKGKRYLDIYRPDGAKFNSPQSQLDQIFGDRMFNPLAFMKLKPAEQAAVIAKIAGINIVEYEQKYKGLYDARADANRKAKEAEGSLTAQQSSLLQALDKAKLADPPKERVLIDAVMDDLRAAQAHNRTVAAAQSDLKHIIDGHAQVEKAHQDAIANVDAVKVQAEKMIANAVAKMNEANFRVDKSKKHIDEMKKNVSQLAEKSTADLEQKIADAEPINTAHRLAEEVKKAREHATAMQANAEAADKKVKDFAAAHKAAIQAAKLPIEGITFDSTGVMVNGIPLAQEAASKRLRISAKIAAAEGHQCRIMVIEDASLLDKEMRRVLNEFAIEENVQLMCEYVSESYSGGIHMVQGRIEA